MDLPGPSPVRLPDLIGVRIGRDAQYRVVILLSVICAVEFAIFAPDGSEPAAAGRDD